MVNYVCDRCGAPANTEEAKREGVPIVIPSGMAFDKRGHQPDDFTVNVTITPLADLCPTCLQSALLIRLKQLGA